MNQNILDAVPFDPFVQPQVAVAHLGSRWNYDIPAILHRLGLLTRFYTDAYCGEGSWLASVRAVPSALTNAALRRLQSRNRSELPAHRVQAFNRLGIEFNLRYGRVQEYRDRLSLFLEINQRFNQLILAKGIPSDTNILFSMNTASLELLERFQKSSIKLVLDQNLLPMQVEAMVLMEEYDRWADWAIDDYESWHSDPIFQQWVEREAQEWKLADLILCAVPYTATALQACGVPAQKCKVIPYPVNLQNYTIARTLRSKSPLRILFVGQVNLRKGIPYFLQMLKQLQVGSFEARVVGPIQIKQEILERHAHLCTFIGAVPRHQVQQHYAWADIFVFPSLCDSGPGTANEALASGLPVITTIGAGTVVQDGIDGWVVANRDVDGLVRCVERLDRDRNLLVQMSHNATVQANKIDLVAYGNQFRQTCEQLLAQPSKAL